jgi:hypothetical protein
VIESAEEPVNMKNFKFLKPIGLLWVVLLIASPGGLSGQTGATGAQTTSATSPSPGGGITAGSGAIETTLFAYRALASDAEAVAREVAAVTHRTKKVVIGTAADVAAFTQWRAIMGEAKVLEERASALNGRLQALPATYAPALSLLPPSLHAIVTHSGSVAPGGTATLIAVVTNDLLAGPTVGEVVVTGSLPAGFTVTGVAATGWTCDPAPNVRCRRSDVLAAGGSYDPISIGIVLSSTLQMGASVTATVVVAGGGSLAVSSSDAIVIAARAPAGRGGVPDRLLQFNPGTSASTTPAATPPASPFSAALGAIPTFIQLAQFLSTAFAVNQTLTPSQGSMTDAPLMNMVARHLRAADVEVYIPSVYTPRVLKGANLTDTYLWRALEDLEAQRRQLWTDIAAAARLLNHANFVTLNPTKYTRDQVRSALLFAGEAQSFINSAQLVATSIDSFEASLFGGQAAAPAAASTGATPAGMGAPAATGAAATGGAAGATGATGATGASASTATSPFTGTQAAPQAPSGTALTAGQGGNILPQILAADLLARELWAGVALTAENFEHLADAVDFLSLHSLESGGSQLTKTNVFYGTHIFFSGGAVMTFSLYEAKGEVVCSGFAYNYRGNVREKKYETTLRSGPAHNAILNTDFSCPAGLPTPGPAIGMTEADLMNLLGPPDSSHFGVWHYRTRKLDIHFEHHQVATIEAH